MKRRERARSRGLAWRWPCGDVSSAVSRRAGLQASVCTARRARGEPADAATAQLTLDGAEQRGADASPLVARAAREEQHLGKLRGCGQTVWGGESGQWVGGRGAGGGRGAAEG